MDAKHEILLEQMLEELRTHTKVLYDLQRRLEDLERAMSQVRDDAGQAVGSTERRS